MATTTQDVQTDATMTRIAEPWEHELAAAKAVAAALGKENAQLQKALARAHQVVGWMTLGAGLGVVALLILLLR